VDASIGEMDIPAVQPGQNAIISVNAVPGTTINGMVSSIAIVPNAQSAAVRTSAYAVKVNFTVPQWLSVKAGMNAGVDIVTNEIKNVLLLPNAAIKKDNLGKNYVKIMNGQQIVRKSVVTGLSNNVQTEIVSGLNDGDKVIIDNPAGKWSLQ
jgi:multidrug efflux pump subunit AcrA (membrane-fusion protein)